jgi:hypothetical protein
MLGFYTREPRGNKSTADGIINTLFQILLSLVLTFESQMIFSPGSVQLKYIPRETKLFWELPPNLKKHA